MASKRDLFNPAQLGRWDGVALEMALIWAYLTLQIYKIVPLARFN